MSSSSHRSRDTTATGRRRFYIYSRDGAGAQLVYPNNLGKPAHEKFEFWDYDAQRKGRYIYGLGTVTNDGRIASESHRSSDDPYAL